MLKNLNLERDSSFWPLTEPPDAPSNASWSARLFAPFTRLGKRAITPIARELSARRATRTLSTFDDRMLRDIGIERDQIAVAARRGRGAIECNAHSKAEIGYLLRW
jgi:uncharacterized protein YjiS (DUF1127 family)